MVAVLLASTAITALVLSRAVSNENQAEQPVPGRASVSALQGTYQRWSKAYRTTNPPGPVLTLAYNRGLSSEFNRAKGIAQIDLAKQTISVRIANLDPQISDVWLVDNLPGEGHSVLPEPGDTMVKVGRLKFENGNAWLDAKVEKLSEMTVDMVVVARNDQDPGQKGVLFGTTSLFQRLFHYPDKQPTAGPAQQESMGAKLLGQLVPEAHAQGFTPPGYFPGLDANLVNKGRNLFLNEKFNGNGRTCATCHREEDNFALGIRLIASLPANDPLFIVEQPTRFDGTPNALFQEFRMEKPALMRRLGLILENQNGFRNPEGGFTDEVQMRAPNHMLSLRTTLAPPPAFSDDGTLPVDPNDLVFAQRTGWSGDGSPTGFRDDFFASNHRNLTGSLRDFAVGAVIQHFTRTLERSAFNNDFRFPTEEELDAIEAFTLSLGRQVENDDLNTIRLFDPVADRGRLNFLGFNVHDTTPDDGRPPLNCNACHFNGGANTNPRFAFPPAVTPNHDLADLAAHGGSIPSHNRSFNPAVESLADQAPDVIVQSVDDPSVVGNCFSQGLGAIPLLPGDMPGTPSRGCSANPFDNGFDFAFDDPFADQRIARDRFNAPPVFEAMDNPPFFHGHQIDTIEGSVAFYATNRLLRNGEFLPAIVPLNGSQVVNVARFLRVMGADFNAKSAIVLLDKARRFPSAQTSIRQTNVRLAKKEVEDAIELLRPVDLHIADAEPLFKEALRILSAFHATSTGSLVAAIQVLKGAQDAMIMRAQTPPPSFDPCTCKPAKCSDCTARITACQSTPGCMDIVKCAYDSACGFPHESCVGGESCFTITGHDQSTPAGQAANGVVSCLGGC